MSRTSAKRVSVTFTGSSVQTRFDVALHTAVSEKPAAQRGVQGEQAWFDVLVQGEVSYVSARQLSHAVQFWERPASVAYAPAGQGVQGVVLPMELEKDPAEHKMQFVDPAKLEHEPALQAKQLPQETL